MRSFKEDIPEMKRIFGKKLDKYFSKKDFEDLEKCSFRKVVKGVKCKTILIVGDREIVVRKKTYSSVLDRSNEAKRLIRGSRLIVVKNGKHDISQKEYHAAIKKVVYKL